MVINYGNRGWSINLLVAAGLCTRFFRATRIMSKIGKFRAVINLIKDVKKRKHKGFADLRWIVAASNDKWNDLSEILDELCVFGMLREEIDRSGKRILYFLLSDNFDLIDCSNDVPSVVPVVPASDLNTSYINRVIFYWTEVSYFGQ